MCTHDRLMYHLESCMEKLEDCFAEIVQKSMLVISLAAGTLVLMVMYIIKSISERAANRRITDTTDDTESFDRTYKARILSLTESTPNVYTPCESSKALLVNCLPSIDNLCKRTISLEVFPTHSSFDDNFMQEVELCVISKPCESCKQTQVSEDLKNARAGSNYWRKRSRKSKTDCLDRLLKNLISFKNSLAEEMYPNIRNLPSSTPSSDHPSTARQCTKCLAIATQSSCSSMK